MYFAKQLIRNACATQAILNISLNLSSNLSVVASTRKPDQCSTGVTLSPELQEFRDFTWDFTPEMRGLALSNCDFIKACHHRYSGFATADSEMAKKEPDEDSDSFHFVGILPMRDPSDPTSKIHIVEMDGLAPYPRILATLEDSKNSYNHQDFKNLQPDWTSTLCPLLMSRMNQCASSDIRFNLMAITQDRLVYLQEKLSKLEKDSSEYQSLLDDMREEKESRLKNSNMNLLRQHDLLPVIQSFCQKYSFL